MHHVIRQTDLPGATPASVRFDGEAYDAGISFFLVVTEPGKGPGLHRHAYPETWIVRSGRVRFTVGDMQIEAGPGEIVVVGTGTPHAFRNVSSDPLEMTCIHAADRIVTEWLDKP